MTDDLIAFLRARLNEDEKEAWHQPRGSNILRNVEAIRRVVDELAAARETQRRTWANYLAWTQNEREPFPDAETSDGPDKIVAGLERAVTLLAATWADHPDYLPEWRV